MNQYIDLISGIDDFNCKILEIFEIYNNSVESLEYGASFVDGENEKLYFYWGSLISGVFAASENLIRGIIIALVENYKSCEIRSDNYIELSSKLKSIFPNVSLNNKDLFISKINKATLNNPLKFVEIFEKYWKFQCLMLISCFKIMKNG